ncbi:hypothetical protein EVAR_46343_1 [Eumeta japonica]|uniref:Uncharacterized protein n=1 Tax=Eumeta variegata TaxID=151549 RepID=A0A4C1WY62_EUMVA|nr:hypothetical protein EVAR_46343_1 [Eumeta japonica]
MSVTRRRHSHVPSGRARSAPSHIVKRLATSFIISPSSCRGNLTVITTGTFTFRPRGNSQRRDRPRCGVAPSAVHASGTAARRSVAAYRIAFRVPRGPLYYRPATGPGPRAVRSSRRVITRERGLLELLRDFEAYCSSPASPVQPDPDLEIEVENNTKKESNKRPVVARPSEGSISDSDASGSDDSDHSDFTDFTTVWRRKASRPKTATCGRGVAGAREGAARRGRGKARARAGGSGRESHSADCAVRLQSVLHVHVRDLLAIR